MKIKKTTKCVRCNKEISRLAKFCPKCGRYVGSGVRSINQMKAMMHKIKTSVPVLENNEALEWYKAHIIASLETLEWAMGASEKNPMVRAMERGVTYES